MNTLIGSMAVIIVLYWIALAVLAIAIPITAILLVWKWWKRTKIKDDFKQSGSTQEIQPILQATKNSH